MKTKEKKIKMIIYIFITFLGGFYLILFCYLYLPITKIYAKEFLNTEIINPVYNENGELIQFTVILKNASPELLEQLYKEVESRNINLMTTEMNKNGVVPLSVTGAGIIKFVQGACVVLAVLSGYGCTDVAHYIGLN